MPNSMTNGARYANVGMICITSRIGVTILRKVALRAVRTPSGTPMPNAIATAAMIAPSVSTVEVHRPRTPTAANPTIANAAIRRPALTSPIVPAASTRPGQPIPWSVPVTEAMSQSMASRGVTNSAWKSALSRLSRIQSRSSLRATKKGWLLSWGWAAVPPNAA